jgi:imidazolonepropionase-like amidohydrolase
MSLIALQHCRVFDGSSAEILEDATVIIEDNRIREVSGSSNASQSAEKINLNGAFLMPGLIDAHVHVCAAQVNLSSNDEVPPTMRALFASKTMGASLQRGFTSLRDAGGADWVLARASETGLIEGPRLFFSGSALSQTGGHGDMRVPQKYRGGCACAYQGGISRLADGEDAVRLAAREELRLGATQIKIMASGGASSPTDPITMLQYTETEIRAAVEEARRWDTYVMAHAYTGDAIRRCVNNGVRSIEHGNLIDADAAQTVASANAFVVPTLVTYAALAEEGAALGFDPVSVEKIAQVREVGLRSLEICRDAGVNMGFGTDLLGALENWQSHEFAIRSEVLSPIEILRSVTSINAALLQRSGELGCVAPGALADLIVVKGDPMRDIGILARPEENLLAVIKDGRFYKNRISDA